MSWRVLPRSSGVELIAWMQSEKSVLAISSEVLFFAAMFLVPGVIALYHSLASVDRAKAATGCGMIASMIPVVAMLDIFQGRLAFPVYGIAVSTPAAAEVVVGIFHGGVHAIGIVFGIATVVLSLAMRRGIFGSRIAYLGFATGLLDIVGAYPYAIGPALTLVCWIFFAAWFAAVGARLYGMHAYREA
jgi:hypothetical protein